MKSNRKTLVTNLTYYGIVFFTSTTLFARRRQLNRRLGNIDDTLIKRVDELPLPDLETLGEDLLDFTSVTDLINWLQIR